MGETLIAYGMILFNVTCVASLMVAGVAIFFLNLEARKKHLAHVHHKPMFGQIEEHLYAIPTIRSIFSEWITVRNTWKNQRPFPI